MSGGLWFFFWPPNWPDAGGSASATASTVAALAPPPGHGSGYWPYRPLDDDYWRLWATRFNPVDATPHATFDLQAQLSALRQRLGAASASASAAAALQRSIDDLDTPDLF